MHGYTDCHRCGDLSTDSFVVHEYGFLYREILTQLADNDDAF